MHQSGDKPPTSARYGKTPCAPGGRDSPCSPRGLFVLSGHDRELGELELRCSSAAVISETGGDSSVLYSLKVGLEPGSKSRLVGDEESVRRRTLEKIATWWLTAGKVVNPASSMLTDEEWTISKLRSASVHVELRSAPVHVELRSASVHVELRSAPVHVELRSAPVHVELRSASVHVELTSAPVHVELRSAPVHVELRSALRARGAEICPSCTWS
ncbi:unnamed protein product [Pleuronectes platessa]|uniref:Uncharacterized protein n=1 Tax=Pleuronectes platessa TaxID=8262 RepID=A0A9N7YZK9_PLEPL|nr:unnamed protein product [Pleuronectes platessa]